jgi:hypothetical protein
LALFGSAAMSGLSPQRAPRRTFAGSLQPSGGCPESILMIVGMDSRMRKCASCARAIAHLGSRKRAPRNDGAKSRRPDPNARITTAIGWKPSAAPPAAMPSSVATNGSATNAPDIRHHPVQGGPTTAGQNPSSVSRTEQRPTLQIRKLTHRRGVPSDDRECCAPPSRGAAECPYFKAFRTLACLENII